MTTQFPALLAKLSLDDLIGLILALGTLGDGGSKQTKITRTDLDTAQHVCRTAGTVLSNWPANFHAALRSLLPSPREDAAALILQRVFGNFYYYFLHVHEREEFAFLRQAFEEFVVTDWPGIVRGQHRAFSPEIRQQFRWIPLEHAARLAGIGASKIGERVQAGEIVGHVLRPAKSHGRTECWTDRDSLSRWIAKRDADLANYMSKSEVRSALGVGSVSVLRIAESGLIGTVDGDEKGFPPGLYYSREDVQKLLTAFELRAAEVPENRDKTELLRDAVRTRLGRNGLVRLIRAVVAGDTAAVGRIETVSGILGYLFRISDIQSYCQRPVKALPNGALTYEAASVILATNTEVIRNMVRQRILRSPKQKVRGVKLVRSDDVARFAAEYVSVKSVAERFDTRSEWIARYLRQRGIQILEIRLPGKGKKLFVSKKAVADIEVPRAERAKAAGAS